MPDVLIQKNKKKLKSSSQALGKSAVEQFEAALPFIFENVRNTAVDLLGACWLCEVFIHRHECRKSDDPLDLSLLQQRVQLARKFSHWRWGTSIAESKQFKTCRKLYQRQQVWSRAFKRKHDYRIIQLLIQWEQLESDSWSKWGNNWWYRSGIRLQHGGGINLQQFFSGQPWLGIRETEQTSKGQFRVIEVLERG